MLRSLLVAATAAGAAAAGAAAAFPPIGSRVSFEPTNNVAVGLRHCNYVCSVDGNDGSDDFNFKIVAALNGNASPGSVSIQSVNFNDHYLSPIGAGAKVGINTNPDADDASFTLTPGLADPSNWTLVTQSKNGALAGFVVSVNSSRTNPCGDGPDVVLAAPGAAGATSQTWIVGSPPPPPPPPPSTLTIDATTVDHVIKREFMGCHMDPGACAPSECLRRLRTRVHARAYKRARMRVRARVQACCALFLTPPAYLLNRRLLSFSPLAGYTQDPLGWTANLVYGQSFEGSPASKISAWNDVTSAGVTATVALDSAVNVNPSVKTPSLSVTFSSGTGVAGWSNRGIGNEVSPEPAEGARRHASSPALHSRSRARSPS